MLETIHEYAHERLAESGEERIIKDRHLQYFLELIEEMAPGYRRQDQIRLLDYTAAEKENLRAAFDWGMASGQVEEAARLVSSMQYFWFYHDSPVEGSRWIARLLAEIDAVPLPYQPRLLFGAGNLAWHDGGLVRGRQLYQRALAIAREIGDKSDGAWTQIFYAIAEKMEEQNAFDIGWRRSEEALAIFKELDDKPGLAQAYNIQGEIAKLAGDNKLARQKYEASLEICQETGEIIRELMLMSNLSMIAYNEGNYREALDLAHSVLEQFIESGTRQGIITALWNIAGPLSMLGQPVKAARLLGASAALFKEMGAADQPTDYDQVAQYTYEVQGQLGAIAFQEAWNEGQAMTSEQAVAYAQSDEP
jgi:non-specific serine/threonine protein kinase